MFGKRPASMQLHTWPVSPSGSLSPERSSILWGFLRKPSLSRTSFETVGTMEWVPQAPGGTRVSSGRVETRGSSRQSAGSSLPGPASVPSGDTSSGRGNLFLCIEMLVPVGWVAASSP